MNKFNFFNLNLRRNLFVNTMCKPFSQQYEGIKGDVNWSSDGEFLDGRPHIRRHRPDLPKKKYGQIRLITSDYSEELKEFTNPIYLAYNRRKRGAEHRQDLVLEKK